MAVVRRKIRCMGRWGISNLENVYFKSDLHMQQFKLRSFWKLMFSTSHKYLKRNKHFPYHKRKPTPWLLGTSNMVKWLSSLTHQTIVSEFDYHCMMNISGGTLSITVIIIGNGVNNQSSNPRWGYLYFLLH